MTHDLTTPPPAAVRRAHAAWLLAVTAGVYETGLAIAHGFALHDADRPGAARPAHRPAARARWSRRRWPADARRIQRRSLGPRPRRLRSTRFALVGPRPLAARRPRARRTSTSRPSSGSSRPAGLLLAAASRSPSPRCSRRARRRGSPADRPRPRGSGCHDRGHPMTAVRREEVYAVATPAWVTRLGRDSAYTLRLAAAGRAGLRPRGHAGGRRRRARRARRRAPAAGARPAWWRAASPSSSAAGSPRSRAARSPGRRTPSRTRHGAFDRLTTWPATGSPGSTWPGWFSRCSPAPWSPGRSPSPGGPRPSAARATASGAAPSRGAPTR